MYRFWRIRSACILVLRHSSVWTCDNSGRSRPHTAPKGRPKGRAPPRSFSFPTRVDSWLRRSRPPLPPRRRAWLFRRRFATQSVGAREPDKKARVWGVRLWENRPTWRRLGAETGWWLRKWSWRTFSLQTGRKQRDEEYARVFRYVNPTTIAIKNVGRRGSLERRGSSRWHRGTIISIIGNPKNDVTDVASHRGRLRRPPICGNRYSICGKTQRRSEQRHLGK